MAAPSRVLLLNGVVMQGDAISRSLLLKREALLQAFGAAVQVDIVTYASNCDLPGTHTVPGLHHVLGLPAFRAADLLIYEFGIFYDLFDSVRFAPVGAHRIGVWHNITPPRLGTSLEARQLLRRSLDQRSNLLACDHVLCDSAFNAAELDELAPEPDRVSVLPLPVATPLLATGAKPWRGISGGGRPLRLLFVGRMVPAKGILDLLQAFARVAGAAGPVLELALVGNTAFSDQAYMQRLRVMAAAAPAPVHFLGQLDDAGLHEQYRLADLFVIPSYHEGYCVPVLEAFAAGCHVVAYDAGNLPMIVGEFGQLVPAGDVEALTRVLAAALQEWQAAAATGREPCFATAAGAQPESARRLMVRRYAAQHSEGLYYEAFLGALARILQRPVREG